MSTKIRGRCRIELTPYPRGSRTEQFAKSALEVADYAYVMDRGRIAIEGTPAHLREDERVLAAYLG